MGNTRQKSTGYRARTRDLFSRPYRAKGTIGLSTYMRTFKVGDRVDVVANAAQHKGMPFKFYHGRTGIVWNVTKRAVGVEINKIHRQRQIKKRIHVRIEHVRKSHCDDQHKARCEENDAKKKLAKEAGEPIDLKTLKRQPEGPKPSMVVKHKKTSVETLTPLPYVFKAKNNTENRGDVKYNPKKEIPPIPGPVLEDDE
mmetsp:Transcript_3962/g.13281  ORF Transcript_3962/g.13281 Transcript_3962/m.13281 type:complete len:198 (-) Transcript_3962:190-783(-)